jgi:hypothetical protein
VHFLSDRLSEARSAGSWGIEISRGLKPIVTSVFGGKAYIVIDRYFVR